ncbi:hypothetical protein D1007_55564 [Hordeum vulgare]|nr:hypothetical protein D1007_55564 [Hordeum vulgare]
MEYEAGLVVSGPMTQLEADIWIQNMENHFGSNLISRKYEVEHALHYFTQSAAIWWKMHHAIQGFSGAETWDEFMKTLLRSRLIQKGYDNPKEKTCACKICGEIGHTQEEHTEGCTHCEENHPAEECPSSQVTCFLCEGTTHYPAECHIYPKGQQVVKQQKDAVKETLKKKILEEPVMNENIEDPDGQAVSSPKPQPYQMEYEAGLVVSGPMTQLEADIWIQNMENHFESNLSSRKYEVEHALQYFTQSDAIWWKMHHAIQGFSGAETWDEFKKTLLRSRLIQKGYDNPKEKTCACKICGEIGHTQEEHTEGCTHCEENHPAEECPSSQVTCFLCEGTTHYPAQCHIYPKGQQVVKQQKDAVKETLKKKILEEPVMNENIEDPDGQGLTRFFSNACYSCGEEGHYSQDCTKGSQEYLGNFPTEKVEFDPLEIEELAKIKESRKKKKYPRKNQISADIDLSHVRCSKCM